MHLLSAAATNAKLKKNLQFTGYDSYILYLAPATEAQADFNVCPASSAGCRSACLFTAGRGRMPSVVAARIRKTLMYINEHDKFMELLHDDLDRIQRKATRDGKKCAVRLNGTSDLDWGRTISMYPSIQFYDYTKVVLRLRGNNLYPNYHVTLSASEANSTVCKRALAQGHNVAVVFSCSELPSEYWGSSVVSGDEHDLRYLDPRGERGYIIGLVAKGEAKVDKSGFVKHVG